MVKRRLVALLQRGYALTLAVRDERTPRKARAVALVALAWVVFPLDLDFVPLLGWIDDAVVVLVASRVVDRLAPEGRFEEFRTRSPSLRRVAPVVFLFALLVVGAFAALVWWLFLA